MMRTPITLACAALTIASLAATASATLIASDSYLSGTDNAAGQYPSGVAISAANTTRVNFGFVNGNYNGGTGTSSFLASASSSPSPSPVATAGGRVFYTGLSTSETNVANRANARTLATAQNIATGTSYFTSQLLTRGANAPSAPTPNTFVGLGFGNQAIPSPGISSGGSPAAALSMSGFFVGFAGTTTANDFGSLVIRARTSATAGQNADTLLVSGALANGTSPTESTTFFVVTKVTANVSGGTDALTYWVNPRDVSSEDAMTASSLVTNAATPLSFFGPQGTAGATGAAADISRLTFAAPQNTPFGTASTDAFRGSALFDEARLGTTLADVTPAPVPEPAALAALSGAGLVALRRRRK